MTTNRSTCPKCSEAALRLEPWLLTSNPPQEQLTCANCHYRVTCYVHDAPSVTIPTTDQLDSLRAEVAQLKERLEKVEDERDDARFEATVHARGCECGDDDACAFAKERDAARKERDDAQAFLDRRIAASKDQWEAMDAAKKERDDLVALLAKLFGWADNSYLHAVMHVENAVNNLRADLAAATKDRDMMLADNLRLIAMLKPSGHDAGSCCCPDCYQLRTLHEQRGEAIAERDAAKAALRMLWKEATDVERCVASSEATHHFSSECRAAVKAVMGDE